MIIFDSIEFVCSLRLIMDKLPTASYLDTPILFQDTYTIGFNVKQQKSMSWYSWHIFPWPWNILR